MDKTEWASTATTFLGILIDGENLVLSIPNEKRVRALSLLKQLSCKHKATVRQLQSLTGYLNFLNKAIFPGRAFTRGMYARYAGLMGKNGIPLKQYHHVRLDSEFRQDCETWILFLNNLEMVNRPLVDLKQIRSATDLNFYTDASRSPVLGMGGIFNDEFFAIQWEEGFIENCQPSITFLELLAATAGLLIWGKELKDSRITIFVDNEGSESMINSQSSKCKHCMKLIRLITLNGLINNIRVFSKHVTSEMNGLADSLSRLQWGCFWELAPNNMKRFPRKIPSTIWPPSKFF